MARKEFTYRGKSIEELKKLSINEFAELVPSSVRRKIKRGFTEQEKIFLREIEKRDNVKTHCREMVILPMMVDKTILIHRGNKFDAVKILPEMVGHILGEYSLTRKSLKHSAPGVGATRSSSAVSVR